MELIIIGGIIAWAALVVALRVRSRVRPAAEQTGCSGCASGRACLARATGKVKNQHQENPGEEWS